MKKILAAVLALVLCMGLFTACGGSKQTNQGTAATEPAETYVVSMSEYIGLYMDDNSQRASMTILPSKEYGDLHINIHWASSAFQASEWDFLAAYDDKTGEVYYHNGEHYETEWADEEHYSKTAIYENGEGTFRFNEDGKLLWISDDESSKDAVFSRVDTGVPTPEQFVNDYFKVVGSYEQGTAGSSLKEAIAAKDAVYFAVFNTLYNADLQKMRDNMLAGWESMSKDDQERFDANFMNVVDLVNKAIENYDSVAGTFEDAGVGDIMRDLIKAEEGRLSWETLSANTFTMGNQIAD